MKKIIYSCKMFTLLEQDVLLPNGYKLVARKIIHPGAVLVIPFLSRNEIIMLRQYRPAVEKYLYELPAGTLEKNESTITCAKRELIEETGYASRKLKKLGLIYPAPGYTTEKIHIFSAMKLSAVKRDVQADEVIEPIIMDKNRLRRLFVSGKLIDAKSICALAMCGWL